MGHPAGVMLFRNYIPDENNRLLSAETEAAAREGRDGQTVCRPCPVLQNLKVRHRVPSYPSTLVHHLLY